jgi:hypothetical protein
MKEALEVLCVFLVIACVVGMGFVLGVGIYSLDTIGAPTALDVYRGKTTLEITYRDNVAIDSTVVYKVK